jgi:hypothetical protein
MQFCKNEFPHAGFRHLAPNIGIRMLDVECGFRPEIKIFRSAHGIGKTPIMNRSLLALLVVVAVSPAFAKSTTQTVTFTSPCLCKGNHGVDRWSAKTDSELLPDKSKIASITPSQIYRWSGVGTEAGLTRHSKRMPSEKRWFALTGRVVEARVEADGDIHIALIDATGNRAGIVSVEIPPGRGWCKMRKLAFSWTMATFPLKYSSNKLRLRENHVITATGKAFYDIDHAPKDRSNDRPKPFPPHDAVWEVHPAMLLRVDR